jgi:hypothetical protein
LIKKENQAAATQQAQQVKLTNDRLEIVDPLLAGVAGIRKGRAETFDGEFASLQEVDTETGELGTAAQFLRKLGIATDVFHDYLVLRFFNGKLDLSGY